MSLADGDLTTPQLYAQWIGDGVDPVNPPTPAIVGSMSRSILNKLNRTRLYSRVYNRTLDGVGNYQLMLPDYPATSIISVQMGAALIQPCVLPSPVGNFSTPGTSVGYGYRFIPWAGDLPGSPPILEFVNGLWWTGAQNIKISYVAGYLISNEVQVIPVDTPWQVTVDQPQGICCLDNGVTYDNGTPLVAVATNPTIGQYIPPVDTAPGVYTFSTGDAGVGVLISYSYIPADLTEACNQMIAERLSYRSRIGVVSQSLGGQETIRYLRGGVQRGPMAGLPPEVADLIMPYYNVTPPGDLGAPL